MLRAPLPHCSLEFQNYRPSDWEAQWLEGRKSMVGDICGAMLQQKNRDLTEAWARSVGPWLDPTKTVDTKMLKSVLDDDKVHRQP